MLNYVLGPLALEAAVMTGAKPLDFLLIGGIIYN